MDTCSSNNRHGKHHENAITRYESYVYWLLFSSPGKTIFGWQPKLHEFAQRFRIIFNALSKTIFFVHGLETQQKVLKSTTRSCIRIPICHSHYGQRLCKTVSTTNESDDSSREYWEKVIQSENGRKRLNSLQLSHHLEANNSFDPKHLPVNVDEIRTATAKLVPPFGPGGGVQHDLT